MSLVNPCGNLEAMHQLKNEIGRIYATRPLTVPAQQTINALYAEWDHMRRVWLACQAGQIIRKN
jgi:hypothetical protein